MNHGHHLNDYGIPAMVTNAEGQRLDKQIYSGHSGTVDLKNGDLAMDFTNNGDLVGGLEHLEYFFVYGEWNNHPS